MRTNELVAGPGEDILIPVKADPYQNRTSLEFGFRARRFQEVQRLIERILAERGRAEILDLGGTEKYWLIGEDFIQANRHRLHFTVVNNEEQSVEKPDLFDFQFGSATDPNLFRGRRFDLVHSNSVIEHVGIWRDMEMFAANARRLAPRYYIQTPNYWFAYEPHFRFPGFQYLPERVRVEMIMRYSLGFFRKIADRREAEEIIYHHRLLSTRQMRTLFPDAAVSHEKLFGLNKSIIAIRDR
ncbi:methyltransferase domain-containing protein [Mesorhizobium australicum]|uniref:Methyltransferase domain-containing protein n=1 Tax=Mesorhizobium australicum TaxID=536018 RepID=A0A1X7PE41_9HYPH|nr:methyltransferase domain-containing protein [Mesorhizobium australicum]SMH48878.1 Methyltransferase domain-containing protein [Mesorhizobium australicum]